MDTVFTEIELIMYFLHNNKHNNRIEIKYTASNVILHINDAVNEQLTSVGQNASHYTVINSDTSNAWIFSKCYKVSR